MAAVVQVAFGIVAGVAVLALGAVFAGRAEGAVYTVAALGFSALGLMLLADLLLVPGLTLQADGSSLAQGSVLVIGLQIGAVSLALLALVLMLIGSLTGLAWAALHRRFAELAVPAGALVALLAGVAATAASLFGWAPLAAGTQRNVLPFVGFGLGTLAAALIAFWAVPNVRRRAASPDARSRAVA